MFHGQVMYRHLKEQKLALFFYLIWREKEEFHRRVGQVFKVTGAKILPICVALTPLTRPEQPRLQFH